MKKKTIVISSIAGIFMLGLCVKFVGNSGDVPVIENVAAEENAVSDELNERAVFQTAEPKSTGEIRPESEELESREPERMESEEAWKVQEPKGQNQIMTSQKIDFVKPTVKWNGEEGILEFAWDRDCIQVDADTLLLAFDCYFPKQSLQQKIFFLAEAPDFMLREVFRQDSRIWDEELKWPECLEWRMRRPHPVDEGYVYELDGVLYFLDKDFNEAFPFCDLRQLMGDFYLFSPGTSNICDVTADASRMLVCMDEGLYEYDLKSGERKLLEPAYFAPHEGNEGDCACGPDFSFSGPARAEYGPDGKSYAFLTGTEEADWGDITGVVLRSGEGETLYQKETEYITECVDDFKWVELEDAVYLAVFYSRDDSEKRNYLLDRVNVGTGEVMTFEVPVEVYRGTNGCVAVGFLDEDNLLYINYNKTGVETEGKNNKNIFEVYRLSSKERWDLEAAGEADLEIMVLDVGGYEAHPVRYPK